MFGEVPNLCPRLHLPLQAGSDRVLARMNRKYDMARYMTLVEGLRAARPDIALSTDLIVGFPGETEEQFQETLDAVRAVNFMSSFSFCYSDRPRNRRQPPHRQGRTRRKAASPRTLAGFAGGSFLRLAQGPRGL